MTGTGRRKDYSLDGRPMRPRSCRLAAAGEDSGMDRAALAAAAVLWSASFGGCLAMLPGLLTVDWLSRRYS